MKNDERDTNNVIINKKMKWCLRCDKEGASNRCSKCKHAFYCSKECQKQDWGEHRIICRSTLHETLSVMYDFHKKWVIDYEKTKLTLIERRFIFFIDLSLNKIICTDRTPVYFKNKHDIKGQYYCVTCSDSFCVQPSRVKDYFNEKDQVWVRYALCSNCESNGDLLCPISFKSVKKCKTERLVHFFWVIIHSNRFSIDIIDILVNVTSIYHGLSNCCNSILTEDVKRGIQQMQMDDEKMTYLRYICS